MEQTFEQKFVELENEIVELKKELAELKELVQPETIIKLIKAERKRFLDEIIEDEMERNPIFKKVLLGE